MIDSKLFKNGHLFAVAMNEPFQMVLSHATIAVDNVRPGDAVEVMTDDYVGVCHELIRQAAIRLNLIPAPIRFYVAGRRWFQKSYGTTYHTVRICDAQMNEIVRLPMECGYGDQYRGTAIQWLQKNGYLPSDVAISSVEAREKFHIGFTVSDVTRQRDL